MKDMESRLEELANKWRYAQPEVFDVCRDALEQIRLLKTQRQQEIKTMHDPNCAIIGWGKGKDE